MSYTKRKIFTFAATAAFLAAALQVSAERMTTMLPGTVKNFELPNFNENTGAKEWELFGDEAAYKSDSRIDVAKLKLLLFEGDTTPKLKATITSPLASVNPVKKFVEGQSDIFVRAPEFKIDGKKWTWDSAKKFVEVFDGIVVDIVPAQTAKESSADKSANLATRITGKYGSMQNDSQRNIFNVKNNVVLENPQMKLFCDSLRADMPKDKKSGAGVDLIDASGNVRMNYENKDIRAAEAKILPDNQTALLTGNPKITDIPSRAEIGGAEIKIDKQAKSLTSLSDAKTRANAIIYNTNADGKEERIAITSDTIKMRTADGKNYFDFSGNVKIAADTFNASCDKLSAQSTASEGKKPEVAYIKGEGKVKLSNENGTATADHMEILPVKSEVVLSDNASLSDPERGMKLTAQAIVFLKERNTGLAFSNLSDKNSFVVLKMKEGISDEKKAGDATETTIKSRRLKFVKSEKNMNFDFDRDVQISSDDINASCQKMEVLALRDAKGGDSVRKITASDSVKISQKGYSAESEIAVIYPKLKNKNQQETKSAPHRYVELLVSEQNSGKRPTIYLPAMRSLGLDEVREDKKVAEKPTVITSDKQWLVGGAQSDRYFFEGDVKATGSDLDVTCKKVEVGMRKLKNGKHSINRIDMFDDVKLSSGLKTATCGKAEVFPEDEMVVLSDSPVVIDREDNTRVSGPRMVYNRGRRSMTVEGEQTATSTAAPERTFIPNFDDDETLSPTPKQNVRPTIKMLPRGKK